MKWLRNILKGASLTGALFVFQACYGTPFPFDEETEMAPMSFKVVSRQTGEPLEGIKVLSRLSESPYITSQELGVTGADGTCRVGIPYQRNVKGPILRFQDESGLYDMKDTVLLDLQEREVLIKLYPHL